MIESVNTVTDLLKSNTQLRDKIEKLNQDIEDKDADIFNVSDKPKFYSYKLIMRTYMRGLMSWRILLKEIRKIMNSIYLRI